MTLATSFEIHPHEGAGPLRFGMAIDQVRSLMSEVAKPFWKSDASEMETDAFDGIGVHVYYRLPGLCDFIEMSKEASPVFQGRKLLEEPFSRILEWFKQQDPELEENVGLGLRSFKLGVAFYHPMWDVEPDTPAEAVSVFERGYYDRYK